MNWFQQKRIEWIEESLKIWGFIQVKHITKKFGISRPKASQDLGKFKKLHPEACVYDMSKKMYLSNERPN